MKNVINASLMFLLLLAGTSAHAVTVIFDGTGTKVTGIEDLDVSGSSSSWDVSFVLPDPADPPPDDEHTLNECDALFTNAPCDPFLSATGAATESIATTAVTAIANALNSQGAASLQVLDTTTGKTSNVINVPYADELGDCEDGPQDPAYCVIRSSNLVLSWLVTGKTDLFPSDTNFAMVRFTPASPEVPVPPAAYLFATGLGLLGSRLRRRRREVREEDAR